MMVGPKQRLIPLFGRKKNWGGMSLVGVNRAKNINIVMGGLVSAP